jgi:dynein heavy chain
VGIVQPKDGVIVHGLFLDAGQWDNEHKILVDPNPGKRSVSFYVILYFFHAYELQDPHLFAAAVYYGCKECMKAAGHSIIF